MHSKKFLRKFLIASLAAGSLIFTPEIYGLPTNTAIVHAEIKEYVGVGESIVSDRETLEIGKQGAKLQAIRNAQKQAGVFIGSYSVVKNNELDTDEVVALTAGVVKINDNVKYEPIQVEQWIKYRATVVVTIDTDDLTAKVNQWVGRSAQDRSTLTEQTKALNGTLDMIQTRTVELETAVLGASTTIDSAKVQEELKQIDRDILYAQKISEGNELMRKGDRAGAMKLYQEAIALYPKDATIAYEKLGDSYLEAKDYARAIDAYSKVIQMDPNYSVPYSKRGQIYLDMNEYRKAIADFEKAIELAPTSTKVYERLVDAYISLGDYDSALASCDKAKMSGCAGFSSSSYSEELRLIIEYTKAIESGSATANDYFKRGDCFGNLYAWDVLSRQELMMTDINKAIELTPDNSKYFCKRGYFYNWVKKYDLAITDFTKAIELNPTYADAYHGRGVVYEYMEQYEKAAQDFEKKIQFGNSEGQIYFNLAGCYDDIVECYKKTDNKAKMIETYVAASKDKRLSKADRDKFKKELEQLKKSK